MDDILDSVESFFDEQENPTLSRVMEPPNPLNINAHLQPQQSSSFAAVHNPVTVYTPNSSLRFRSNDPIVDLNQPQSRLNLNPSHIAYGTSNSNAPLQPELSIFDQLMDTNQFPNRNQQQPEQQLWSEEDFSHNFHNFTSGTSNSNAPLQPQFRNPIGSSAAYPPNQQQQQEQLPWFQQGFSHNLPNFDPNIVQTPYQSIESGSNDPFASSSQYQSHIAFGASNSNAPLQPELSAQFPNPIGSFANPPNQQLFSSGHQNHQFNIGASYSIEVSPILSQRAKIDQMWSDLSQLVTQPGGPESIGNRDEVLRRYRYKKARRNFVKPHRFESRAKTAAKKKRNANGRFAKKDDPTQ